MKRLSMILALVFLITITACSTGVKNNKVDTRLINETTSPNASNDKIKIGWIGDLSGKGAPTGVIELNVLRMVLAEVNLEGGILGKKLEIVGYDAKSTVPDALKGVRELIDKEKVVAIIGPNTSRSAIFIAKILQEKKIPGIVTSATNPKVTLLENGKANPYMFRICFTDDYQGKVAARFVKKTLEISKAAVLYDRTDNYSKGLGAYFIDAYKKFGGEIVASESFAAGDTNFLKQLKKIKAKGAKVLYLPDFFYDVYGIAEQASRIGLKARMIGGDAWGDADIPEKMSKYLEKSFYITHIDSDSPETIDFKNKYIKAYGENLDSGNPYPVHDALITLLDAIKRAGTVESGKVIAALEKTKIYGVTGPIEIDTETHNPKEKDAVVMRIINGKFVFYQKLTSSK